jgi:hypothetical protein
MKKSILAVGAAAILAISLSACGSSVSSSTGPAESQAAVEPVVKTTPTTAPTTDGKPKSARGNVIKQFGEPSFWKESSAVPDDEASGKFTVTKVEDVTCTQQYASPPTNGKVIGLTIDVETSAILADKPSKEVFLTPYDFKYIGANGTTFNGTLSSVGTMSCIDQSLVLKSSFGPAEKAHGMVLLDVPAGGGVLTVGKVEWSLP